MLLLLPAIVLSGMSTLWGAVLNAHSRFLVRAAASVAIGVCPLALVLTLGRSWGVFSLALGTLAGYAIEAAVIGLGMRAIGVPLLPRWHGWNSGVKEVLGQFAPMVLGALVMSANPIVDQSMAATLAPGSVAAIGYGGKAVAVVLSLGSMAISTALLPHFSAMVAHRQWSEIGSTLRTYGGAVLALSAVVTALGVFYSPQIVELAFQRGNFTARDSRLVATIQALYLLQLPFHLTGILFVRLISAMGKNQVLMGISVMNVATNLVGNILLSRSMGVSGIALSTSIVFCLSSLVAGGYVTVSMLRTYREAPALPEEVGAP